MAETYKQHLKALANSFKTLNVQLMGFLLVALEFLFTSDNIMANVDLYWVTGGLAWTVYLWAALLIHFLTIKFSQPETKPPQKLFNNMRWGNRFFGAGLVVLVAVLVYIAL